MGCSCKGFRLVSACRGMILGTAPSGFLDRVPCQRLNGPPGPFGGGWRVGWGRLGLVIYGGRNWRIWRPTGRQILQQCFSLRPQPQLRHSAEEAPCLQEFHLCWRDFLSIKNPAFWCISIKAPPAFIGSSNAAPEWQAVTLRWHSGGFVGACPLKGLVSLCSTS